MGLIDWLVRKKNEIHESVDPEGFRAGKVYKEEFDKHYVEARKKQAKEDAYAKVSGKKGKSFFDVSSMGNMRIMGSSEKKSDIVGLDKIGKW